MEIVKASSFSLTVVLTEAPPYGNFWWPSMMYLAKFVDITSAHPLMNFSAFWILQEKELAEKDEAVLRSVVFQVPSL